MLILLLLISKKIDNVAEQMELQKELDAVTRLLAECRADIVAKVGNPRELRLTVSHL